MSFYCGPASGNLVKANGSRLSILSDYREMQSQSNEKKYGSRLSVASAGGGGQRAEPQRGGTAGRGSWLWLLLNNGSTA